MFNKLFGKKKDGFYMQIDESAPSEAAEPKTAQPEAVKAKETAPKAKVNAAQALAMKILPKAKAKGDVATETAPQPEVALASVAVPEALTTPETKSDNALVAEAPTAQKNKSTKTSIKKGKKEEDKKPEKDTASPEVVAAAAPVAPMFTNFATDYLVTPAVAGNRRRPGANMKGFMSMAKDVKDMKKGSVGNQIKTKAAKKTEA